MQKALAVVKRRAGLASIVTVGTLAAIAAPSMADAPTYDVTPVVTGLTGDLTANIPTILTAVGALIALGIAVRMVRKFVKA